MMFGRTTSELRPLFDDPVFACPVFGDPDPTRPDPLFVDVAKVKQR